LRNTEQRYGLSKWQARDSFLLRYSNSKKMENTI
jgi:hypothetical protein